MKKISFLIIFILFGLNGLFGQAADSFRVNKYFVATDADNDTLIKISKDSLKFLERFIWTANGIKNFMLDGSDLTFNSILRYNSPDIEFRTNSQWYNLTSYGYGWHPLAGFAPSDSGATQDTLQNYEEVYLFDNSSDEYLYYVLFPPYGFSAIPDTFRIMTSTSSSAGDSVGWQVSIDGHGNGDAVNDTYSTLLSYSKQFDLASANQNIFCDIPITLLTFDAYTSSKIIIRLRRDTSIANNIAAAVRNHGVWLHVTP